MFSLVEAVVGAPKITPAENPVVVASAEIEQCRTTRLPIAEAAVFHQHPEQATFLFERLDLGDPAEAVVTISFFLDRVDQLESGKSRKATHKADLAAVATLEARGFTKAERKRLQGLVQIIQTNTAPILTDAATSDLQDEKLLELQAWLVERTSAREDRHQAPRPAPRARYRQAPVAQGSVGADRPCDPRPDADAGRHAADRAVRDDAARRDDRSRAGRDAGFRRRRRRAPRATTARRTAAIRLRRSARSARRDRVVATRHGRRKEVMAS